jgi:hypothetical protein
MNHQSSELYKPENGLDIQGARGGSGKLDSEDKWNFCLNAA